MEGHELLPGSPGSAGAPNRRASARAPAPDAFDALYREHAERIRRLCFLRLGDAAEAEDATQETLTRAWRALPRLRGERRVRPWLDVIARNVCTDILRRRSRVTLASAARIEQLLAAQTPERGGTDPDSAAALATALSLLPARHREVLAQREVLGWTYRRMAAHGAVDVATIQTRIFRARRALRARFVAARQALLEVVPIAGRLRQQVRHAGSLLVRLPAGLGGATSPGWLFASPLRRLAATAAVAAAVGAGLTASEPRGAPTVSPPLTPAAPAAVPARPPVVPAAPPPPRRQAMPASAVPATRPSTRTAAPTPRALAPSRPSPNRPAPASSSPSRPSPGVPVRSSPRAPSPPGPPGSPARAPGGPPPASPGGPPPASPGGPPPGGPPVAASLAVAGSTVAAVGSLASSSAAQVAATTAAVAGAAASTVGTVAGQASAQVAARASAAVAVLRQAAPALGAALAP
ncbi:MAG TPA: sigma-70 family RNA polymerase sigma factor [Acidimicrobiales bacterium]|nr:sigma-70 family RNA polymerase sigma factor [Acidimicrobiales bacterium]